MIRTDQQLRLTAAIGLGIACVLILSAAFSDCFAILSQPAMLLGKVHLVFFAGLFIWLAALRFRLSTGWLFVALCWTALNLPFHFGGARNPQHGFALLMLSVLSISSLIAHSRHLWAELPKIARCRSFQLGQLFFGCYLISGLLNRLIGGIPLLSALFDSHYSAFGEPVVIAGSYALIFVTLLHNRRGDLDRLDTASLFQCAVIVLGLAAVIQFLITNHPTYSFYREFSPITLGTNDPLEFQFLYFILFIASEIAIATRATIKNSPSTIISRIIAACVLTFTLNIFIAAALTIFFSARTAPARWNPAQLARRAFFIGVGVLSFIAAWSMLSLHTSKMGEWLLQTSDSLIPGLGTLRAWQVIAGSWMFGIGPWYHESALSQVLAFPGRLRFGALTELLLFGGLLLLVPWVTTWIAAVRSSHCTRRLVYCLIPFIVANQLLTSIWFMLSLLSILAVLDSTPSAVARTSRRILVRAVAIGIGVTAIAAILSAASVWVYYKAVRPPISKNLSTSGPVPETFVYGLLLMEDSKFFEHRGFDFPQLVKSVRQTIERETFSMGGSTISMQLAKKIFLSERKTLVRKAMQIVLAFYLECEFKKSDLLQYYIQNLDFNLSLTGLDNAAKTYFKKQAEDLNIDQAFQLIMTIPNPKHYNPGHPITPEVRNAMKRLASRFGHDQSSSDWMLLRQKVQQLRWIKREPQYFY